MSGFVCRDSRDRRRKFHIATDRSCMTVLCGQEPGTPAGFLNRGDREVFERMCPERICKRCRLAEEARA